MLNKLSHLFPVEPMEELSAELRYLFCAICHLLGRTLEIHSSLPLECLNTKNHGMSATQKVL